jgi:hypothetical protein
MEPEKKPEPKQHPLIARIQEAISSRSKPSKEIEAHQAQNAKIRAEQAKLDAITAAQNKAAHAAVLAENKRWADYHAEAKAKRDAAPPDPPLPSHVQPMLEFAERMDAAKTPAERAAIQKQMHDLRRSQLKLPTSG